MFKQMDWKITKGKIEDNIVVDFDIINEHASK